MLVEKYNIEVLYTLDDAQLTLPLSAAVEVHASPQKYYLVRDFQTPGRTGESILPAVELVRVDSHWVHLDSRKESALSVAIGRMIERHEAEILNEP